MLTCLSTYLSHHDIGYPIKLEGDFGAASAQKEVGEFISSIRETPDGGSVKLSVLRGDNNYKDVVARQSVEVNIQPTRASASAPKSIGIML
jgi:hypothetical protein